MFFRLVVVLVSSLIVNQANGALYPSYTEIELLNDDSTYGLAAIGDPGQKFNFLFDSGSSMTWIMSSKFRGECENSVQGYDSSLSKTHKENNKKFEGQGFGGFLSEDVFNFGADIQVKGQTFAEIDNYPGKTMCWRKFTGSFGLGLSNGSEPNTLIGNMIEQNLLPRPVVALNFMKHDKTRKSPTGGSVILGGLDSYQFRGEVYYIASTSSSEWKLDLANILVGGELKFCENGCSANIESGQYWNYGPADEIRKINKAIGSLAERINEGVSTWIIDCDPTGKPDVVFEIAGKEYVFEAKDYIVERRFEPRCDSAFASRGGQQEAGWILGANFIEKFYTVFNYATKEIGLATKRDA